MIIRYLGQFWDNHFLLCNFIITTINVSNAMINIPKLIIKDRASETVIIRLTSFLCSIVKEAHLLLYKKNFAFSILSSLRGYLSVLPRRHFNHPFKQIIKKL